MSNINREISNIYTIGRKEFMDNVMSKRFLGIGIFYVGMSLLLAAVVTFMYYSTLSVYNDPSVAEISKMQAEYMLNSFSPDMVLSYINILNLILALLAMIVTCDTISLERKDRTMYQLLSKPVDRSSIILGKFLGNLSIVTLLFLAGASVAYVIVAVLTGKYPDIGHIPSIVAAILSMVVLLAVYVSMGMIISSVTRNPFISIISSLLVWMGMWFSATVGNMVGDAALYSKTAFVVGDPFTQYPIYAKIMVWLDPLSHGILPQLLDSTGSSQVAAGLPLWANMVFLLAYMGVFLLGSIVVFERSDL